MPNLAQPLREQYDMTDGDLLTPAHDAVTLWLDEHIEKVIRDIVRPMTFPTKKRLNEMAKNRPLDLSPDEIWYGDIPKFSDVIDINEKTWEQPLMNSGGHPIGYCDMAVDAVFTVVEWRRRWVKSDRFKLERDRNGVTYEKYEFDEQVGWAGSRYRQNFYFEVKPTIQSIGAVVRQIRKYEMCVKRVMGKPDFHVVSPDIRFKDIFVAQRIGFVEVPLREAVIS